MGIQVSVLPGPLPLELCLPAQVLSPRRGAIASFVGVVRDHAKGREVGALFYECHERMAVKVLDRLAQEAQERFDPAMEIVIRHGHGAMVPGDVSICILAGSAHRAAACDATRLLIERIKQEVPIWKRQTYADGSCEWIYGS